MPSKFSAHAAGRHGELAGAGVFDAIEQENIVQRPPARNRKGVSHAGDGIGALQAITDGSGIQRDEVVEAASVERQILYFALAHNSGNRGSGGIDHRRFRHHGYLLHQIADFELQVHDGFLADCQVDTAADHGLKAGLFRLQFLLPQRQGENPEVAIGVGGDGSRGAGFDALHGDGYARDSGAGGVFYPAGNCGGYLSAKQSRREQQDS